MFTATHSTTLSQAEALLALAELHNATVVLNHAPQTADNPYGNYSTIDGPQPTATWYVAEEDKQNLTLALCELGFTAPEWQPVDTTLDFVAINNSTFAPLTIGNITITQQQSHPNTGNLTPTTEIIIPPNSAFGSGEHATTSGCLLALQRLLAEGHTYSHALDFGCGSAILALAFSKLTGHPCLGIDNDPLATTRATENVTANDEEKNIEIITDDAPHHRKIQAHRPFPLIFANVLLGPLLTFAEPLTNLLAPNGHIILSGITTPQESDITRAYGTLKLHHRHEYDGWLTLTFTKAA